MGEKLIPDNPFTLEGKNVDIQVDHQSQSYLVVSLKPNELLSTYDFRWERKDFVQWLLDTIDQFDQHPYREILDSLKRIENKLKTK